jgi:hypothetical protein
MRIIELERLAATLLVAACPDWQLSLEFTPKDWQKEVTLKLRKELQKLQAQKMTEIDMQLKTNHKSGSGREMSATTRAMPGSGDSGVSGTRGGNDTTYRPDSTQNSATAVAGNTPSVRKRFCMQARTRGTAPGNVSGEDTTLHGTSAEPGMKHCAALVPGSGKPGLYTHLVPIPGTGVVNTRGTTPVYTPTVNPVPCNQPLLAFINRTRSVPVASAQSRFLQPIQQREKLLRDYYNTKVQHMCTLPGVPTSSSSLDAETDPARLGSAPVLVGSASCSASIARMASVAHGAAESTTLAGVDTADSSGTPPVPETSFPTPPPQTVSDTTNSSQTEPASRDGGRQPDRRNVVSVDKTIKLTASQRQSRLHGVLETATRLWHWMKVHITILEQTKHHSVPELLSQCAIRGVQRFLDRRLMTHPPDGLDGYLRNAVYESMMTCHANLAFFQRQGITNGKTPSATIFAQSLHPEHVAAVQATMASKSSIDLSTDQSHPYRDVLDVALFGYFFATRTRGVDFVPRYYASHFGRERWCAQHSDVIVDVSPTGSRPAARPLLCDHEPVIVHLFGQWVVLYKGGTWWCRTGMESIATWCLLFCIGQKCISRDGGLNCSSALGDVMEDWDQPCSADDNTSDTVRVLATSWFESCRSQNHRNWQ